MTGWQESTRADPRQRLIRDSSTWSAPHGGFPSLSTAIANRIPSRAATPDPPAQRTCAAIPTRPFCRDSPPKCPPPAARFRQPGSVRDSDGHVALTGDNHKQGPRRDKGSPSKSSTTAPLGRSRCSLPADGSIASAKGWRARHSEPSEATDSGLFIAAGRDPIDRLPANQTGCRPRQCGRSKRGMNSPGERQRGTHGRGRAADHDSTGSPASFQSVLPAT
jgi:hypothetical protein